MPLPQRNGLFHGCNNVFFVISIIHNLIMLILPTKYSRSKIFNSILPLSAVQ